MHDIDHRVGSPCCCCCSAVRGGARFKQLCTPVWKRPSGDHWGLGGLFLNHAPSNIINFH